MPIDPSIISGAFNQNQGVSPNALLGIMQFAQQEQDRRRELAKENQLAAILSNPTNYGPDKQLTQNALRQASSVDPETGVKLQDQTMRARIQSLQANAMMSEQGQRKFDISTSLAGAGVDAYDDAIANGKSPEDAMAAFRKARNEAADNLGGVLGNEDVDRIKSQPGDINTARALAGFNKEWTTRQTEKSREKYEENREKKADESEAERERHDKAIEDEAASRQKAAKDRAVELKDEILTDPKTNTQFVYNPVTKKSTTLDGKPYEPTGATKLGSKDSGFSPEMGQLMGALAERGVSLPTGMRSKDQQVELYKGLLERNKGKSPDEIADMIKTGQIEFGAQKKETGTAAGIAGKVEVAANEIDQFIPLVEDASSKVTRGSFMPLNKLMQTGEAQISDPNLRALKIRINSLLNAYDMLASRGGTDKDKREEVRNLLLSADSPEVLATALKSFKLESDAAHKAAVAATKVPELEGPKAAGARATPKVGDVQQGYRFKGGDPSDPHNWEKVQ